MSPERRPSLVERVIPLAIAAFAIGPLAHMALHRPDHHHTPDGGVVFVTHAPHGPHGAHHHPHPHPHPADTPDHGHGSHGPGGDGPSDHPHADGGAAHLGLSPPPPAPVALPARRVARLPDPPAAPPPAYRPLRGHHAPTARRARAPPA